MRDKARTGLKSPIRWFGGKGRLASRIAPLLEAVEHRVYVEPFGGGASVLLAKCPVEVEVYNDIDHSLYEFFCVLSQPSLFKKFYRRVALLPNSRVLYDKCCEEWEKEEDLIERVAKWFVVARQAYSGHFASGWSSTTVTSRRGMSMSVSQWLSCIENLPGIHARLQRVLFECVDWRKVLKRYDSPETVFYCDPPYVPQTRSGGEYRFELSLDDHKELTQALLELKGRAALSGYEHDVYEPLLEAGWLLKRWDVMCHVKCVRGVGTRSPRRECIYLHPGLVASGRGSLGVL